MTKGYSVRVERDSIGPDKCGRATTWVIRFPRRVLAETVTHRLSSDLWGEWSVVCTERTTTEEVSKNSASSRAIPFQRMLDSVVQDPFVPQWTKNAKGMQGEGISDTETIRAVNAAWNQAVCYAIESARKLHDLGVHKQDCNRLLEPFAWTTQVVTMTRPDNFFALRTHEAADPHFRTIARMMYLSLLDSTPTSLDYGQWHLPFTDTAVKLNWIPNPAGLTDVMQMPPPLRNSAARCAWISYENHDRDGTQEAVDRTFSRLFAEIPMHASPCEHQLSPMYRDWEETYPRLKSNCAGWLQARKLIPHEKVSTFKASEDTISQWREEVSQWYKKS